MRGSIGEPKSRSSRGKCERGFSSIDILSVVALIAIVMALAVPWAVNSMRAYELQSTAEQLAAELNAARVMALSRGTTYQLVVNPSNRTFRIIDTADPGNPTRVARSLEGNVTFSSIPNPPITFSSRGVARGGLIRLAGGGSILDVVVGAGGKVEVGTMKVVGKTEPSS